MSSPAEGAATDAPDDETVADLGLLSPSSAGTRAEVVTGDRAVLTAMVRAETALLGGLAQAGLAPSWSGGDPFAGVEIDVRGLALAAVEGGNPVIPLVRLLRAAAPAGLRTWVHHGATSQDIVDTALALVATDTLTGVAADLDRLADALALLVAEHRDTPLVARTLTQQALPSTLGFRAAGWLAGVLDAVAAVRACLPLPASLAGPVGTASAYGQRGPTVLTGYADLLGLATPVGPWHTRRTPWLQVASAAGLVTAACGKVAADVLVMSQTEIGEVSEAGGGPSSSMAHKANPAGSVLIASAARQAPALVSVMLASAVAEQERPAGAWHAEWQSLRSLLRLAGAASERTAALVPSLRFDPEAMAANLDRLSAAVAAPGGWVAEHTASTGIWVDRVLAHYAGAHGPPRTSPEGSR